VTLSLKKPPEGIELQPAAEGDLDTLNRMIRAYYAHDGLVYEELPTRRALQEIIRTKHLGRAWLIDRAERVLAPYTIGSPVLVYEARPTLCSAANAGSLFNAYDDLHDERIQVKDIPNTIHGFTGLTPAASKNLPSSCSLEWCVRRSLDSYTTDRPAQR
jgi:hypothetical protein